MRKFLNVDSTFWCYLRPILKTVFQVVVLTAATLISLSFLSIMRFGSPKAGRAWLSGTRILVVNLNLPRYYNQIDQKVKVEFGVSNLTGKSIRIIGSDSSCSCNLVGKIPDTLGPNSLVTISADIKIDTSSEIKESSGEISLYTDHPRHPEILLKYVLKPNVGIVEFRLNHFLNAGLTAFNVIESLYSRLLKSSGRTILLGGKPGLLSGML